MTTQRTPIVDKNGKLTHVHKRTGRASSERVPAVAPASSEPERVNPTTDGSYTTAKGTDYDLSSRPSAVGEPTYTVKVEGASATVQQHDDGSYYERGERMGKTLDEVANRLDWNF